METDFVYRLRDKETGLFFKSGYKPTWNSIGRFMSKYSLQSVARMFKDKRFNQNRYEIIAYELKEDHILQINDVI